MYDDDPLYDSPLLNQPRTIHLNPTFNQKTENPKNTKWVFQRLLDNSRRIESIINLNRERDGLILASIRDIKEANSKLVALVVILALLVFSEIILIILQIYLKFN